MGNLISDENRKYSFTEYMAMEQHSKEHHDFYFGEIFGMSGSTKNHNNIIANLAVTIKANKKSSGGIFIKGMKLEIVKDQFYVYPDLIYTSDDDLRSDEMYVKRPSIIFEIFSEANSLYVRQEKLKYYREIPSLQYYVLVDQKEIRIEVYSNIDDKEIWKYQTFETINEIIEFERLEFSLPGLQYMIV